MTVDELGVNEKFFKVGIMNMGVGNLMLTRV